MKGYGIDAIKPHNVTFTLPVAGLLWFGWFGFNAGSALSTDEIAGLVSITPGAVFVTPMPAIVIGFIAGIVYYGGVMLKGKLGYDDSLDVFGVHGVGGLTGALLTGVFASVGATGFLPGNSHQFLLHLEGVVITIIYASVCTIIIGFVLEKTIGLKVSESDKNIGFDKTPHCEIAYNI